MARGRARAWGWATGMVVGLLAAPGNVAVAVAQEPGGGADAKALVGLWVAARTFGPEVGGPVTLWQDGSRLRGEIAGRSVEARLKDEVVSFQLPGDLGSFRGRVSEDGQTVRGHWIQPWNYSSFSPLASPATLSRSHDGTWTGTVVPKPDRLRFYLKIEAPDGGEVRAFLRNPEANIGRFYSSARVVRDGDQVRFYDAQERLRLTGTVDERFGRLSVYFPLNGGTYDFVRADEDPASLFYPRPTSDAPYRYTRPLAGEGWASARPEDVGMAVAPVFRPTRSKESSSPTRASPPTSRRWSDSRPLTP